MKNPGLERIIKKLSKQNKAIFIHGERVAKLACSIAKKMCFSCKKIIIIECAAIVHDIGKTKVSTEIINKPAALDGNELVIMRKHPEFGYQLLQSVKAEPIVCQVALQHHERLDGSGYPFGLLGDEIIPEAKIIAVADVIETMVSDQVYRPALTMAEVLQVIKQNSGLRYNPEVVAASLLVIEDKKK